MRFPVKPFTMITLLLFSASTAFASEVYIYPAKGQSSEQQEKDKFECYTWARNDTGFDPMAVPTTTTAAPSSQRSSGGAVKGALGGAVLGKVLGSSSRTTKRSAVAGGVLGGVHQSSKNRQVDQGRQQWEQKESANYANNRNNYNRAYSACLEGRGYTVR